MEGVNDKKENTTIVTLSAKVYETDREDILKFAKTFPNVRDGFTEIVKRIQAEPETITIEVPIEKNLEQVFEFSSYKAFLEPTDTHPSDTIKRALEFANTAKENVKEDTIVIPGRVLEFTPTMETKLTALRRYLKSKGKVPTEATEKQFLEKFIEVLLNKHIDNNFDFLNKD